MGDPPVTSTQTRSPQRRASRQVPAAVRLALRRRGLAVKGVRQDQCILPAAAAARVEYYQLLRHYSFRLFLRDVIKHRDGFVVDDLVRYCSLASARGYLRWLRAHGLVRRAGARFRLLADAPSFGPTLEWVVAAILEREYGIPCAWNLRLDGTSGGGDYDVIGFQEGACVYIETKSSPPRNIDAAQVRAFVNRIDTLRPQVAIFLNDTQLRMADKMVPLFRAELRRRLARACRIERVQGELFAIGSRVFIANSDPDLAMNLGVCLARHFRGPALHLDERR